MTKIPVTTQPSTNALRVLIACLAVFASSCTESNFVLSPDSRLPKWFTPPSGMSRQDINVTIGYYIVPWGPRKTRLTMREVNGRQLAKPTGTLEDIEPKTLEPHSNTEPIPYPHYEVISVDGVVNIIEHRRHGAAVLRNRRSSRMG